VQQEPDLRPEPAENGDSDEEELDWEGDPDDLLGVLVEVTTPPDSP